MIESVSHLFSSTTCAATHVDGEGGESDLLQQIQMSVQKPVLCGGRQVTWSGQTEVSPSPRCCCAPCPCPPWWWGVYFQHLIEELSFYMF